MIHYRYQATQGETLLSPGASDNITGGKLVLSHFPNCSAATTTTTAATTTTTAGRAAVLGVTVTTDPGVLPVTGVNSELLAVGLLSLLLGVTLVAGSRRMESGRRGTRFDLN